MKKITLVSFALTPIVLFAQAPAPSSSFDGFGLVLMALLICVIIFIVCRELLCWYYKINKMVSNQEEIIRLLKLIADRDNSKTNQENKEIIIDPFHKK
jgi:hypothetical protein